MFLLQFMPALANRTTDIRLKATAGQMNQSDILEFHSDANESVQRTLRELFAKGSSQAGTSTAGAGPPTAYSTRGERPQPTPPPAAAAVPSAMDGAAVAMAISTMHTQVTKQPHEQPHYTTTDSAMSLAAVGPHVLYATHYRVFDFS
jgi:hypothetical protein